MGGFLASVLWEKLEISSRCSLRCGKKTLPEKFAGKVVGGECFLTTIRPTGKSFPGIDDTGKLERIRFSPLALRTGTDDRNERCPEREMVGLRDGQRDLAGMNDGLNKRRPEGIRVSENWL